MRRVVPALPPSKFSRGLASTKRNRGASGSSSPSLSFGREDTFQYTGRICSITSRECVRGVQEHTKSPVWTPVSSGADCLFLLSASFSMRSAEPRRSTAATVYSSCEWADTGGRCVPLDIMKVADAEPITPDASRAKGIFGLSAPAAVPLEHDRDRFTCSLLG